MGSVALGAEPVPFIHSVVDPVNPANPHCKAIGDINGDGQPDLLAASSAGDGLHWYEYPSWTKHIIGAGSFTTDMQVADIDGDGDLDVIIPTSSGLYWYRNPRPVGDPAIGAWTSMLIGSAGANAHSVETGDLNRDGRIDVVSRGKGGAETVFWQQVNPTTWNRITVSTAAGEGTALGDLDGDGDLDIAQNGFWLENPGHVQNVQWVPREVSSNWPADVGVLVVDLNQDGRNDVVLGPSESTGRFSWYETASPLTGPWTEHSIDSSVSYLHTFKAGDVDNDGDLDLVTAEMHQSSDPDEVSVYFNNGKALSWSQQLVASSGSHNLRIADIGQDGDLDIFGANWNDAAPNSAVLDLWESGLGRAEALPLDSWRRHVIDAQRPWRSLFITAGDVDGDGRNDVITGAWWYQNPGNLGLSWVRNAFGSPLNNMAAVQDLDLDGDLDVLGIDWADSSGSDSFVWGRNDGAGNFDILNNVSAANGDFLQGVAVGQFQPGGPLEIMLSWHASGVGVQALAVPPDPAASIWPWRQVSATSQNEQLSAGDIDRDGDLDLLLGTQWFRNDGSTWTIQTLSIDGGLPDRNRLADINRDGRLDAIVGFEGSSQPVNLTWYEQPATVGSLWTGRVISSLIGPMSLDVGDLDQDGDIDLVVGEHNLSSPDNSRLIIYENVDSGSAVWPAHVVFTGDEHHDGAQLVDIDGDGDLDILSIGWSHGRTLLYENLAIQQSNPF